jgi:acyl-CoA reductase-like NAD-dependent aldehyde dehydrogenase
MKKLVSISPDNTIGKLGVVEITSEIDIKEAVSKARSSFKKWGKISVEERKQYLEKTYEIFHSNREELAKLGSMEMGMPIVESRIDVDSGLNYFKWYLENTEKYISPEVSFKNDKELHTVLYEPIGIAAVIMPWNYPFSNFIWGVIPNLVVGNTVVFKHSEEIPLICKKYEELISTTNLPKGVLNFIYGDGKVGDILVHEDIDLICFTGSTKTGQYLYKVGAEKMIKVVLELGGSAPGVVFEDADLETVIESIMLFRFSNCGQMCDGLKRVIIHESLADEFIAKIKGKLESIKIGNPLEENTNIGPLVAQRQVELVEEQVKDALEKGAEIVVGGKRPDNLEGSYYLPTILTNISKDMRVWKEEVFGPVLPVVTFKTYEEALKLANDTRYGLGSYVFTKDNELGERSVRDIKTGMVSINGAFYVIPQDPFGGCKMSGMGREHGKWGLRELTEVKVVAKYK